MARKRLPPDDPREWLNRARNNLVRAQNPISGNYLEDYCFDAQQAAEKAHRADECPLPIRVWLLLVQHSPADYAGWRKRGRHGRH